MSVFTQPINARLMTEEAYTRSGYTFPQTGFVPAVYTVSLGFGDVTGTAASSITRNAFVVPSGYALNDLVYNSSALWTGASVGSTLLTVLAGSQPIFSSQSLTTQGFSRPTGSGVPGFGVPFAADTTISYSVSVSGTAAQGCSLASLTTGAGVFSIAVGVPFDQSTRG